MCGGSENQLTHDIKPGRGPDRSIIEWRPHLALENGIVFQSCIDDFQTEKTRLIWTKDCISGKARQTSVITCNKKKKIRQNTTPSKSDMFSPSNIYPANLKWTSLNLSSCRQFMSEIIEKPDTFRSGKFTKKIAVILSNTWESMWNKWPTSGKFAVKMDQAVELKCE